jgi:hypothetical protein
VALLITDVSEKRSASIIRVTRIGELERTLAVTSNRRRLYAAFALYTDEDSLLAKNNASKQLCYCIPFRGFFVMEIVEHTIGIQ